jgi:Nif-specific regulatory protein
MNPRLVGVRGSFNGVNFALAAGEIGIGRDAANSLWVADPGLSRRHCVIAGDGSQFRIRDLGSRNGTRVNGVPVEQQELHHRDQIAVGDSVLVFLLEQDEAALQESPIELRDTGDLEAATVLLRPEDSIYLRPGSMLDATPQSRVANDLNCLLTIAKGIGRLRDREAMEWQLLGMAFDVVPADRGAILRFSPGTEEVESAIGWDRLLGPGKPVPVSRTVVRQVRSERVGLMISDVSTDTSLRKVETLRGLQTHSLLCVPLLASGTLLGLIYLDSRDPAQSFDQNHLQVMIAVAGIAALALDNARHWENLQEENRLLQTEINLEHDMVGESPGMRQVYELIRRVAPTDSTVLIQGESGTGKELAARAIHRNSPRAERPFVAINCAALTETLLESELFGHERGAFTGAVAQKKGKVEVAHGGTLFLDEVTEMSAQLQPKLLRVLQEREFERVGGTRPIKADIRVVAATNRSLQEAADSGSFRKDLYYRLNVVTLTMPPLRERREDIPVLAQYFIAKACGKGRIQVKSLSPEARSCLTNYDWPGNVRELENAMERAVVLGSGAVILPDDLPEGVLEASSPASGATAKYHGSLRESKKQLVVEALRQANGNYVVAAQILGLHPNSLLRLIRNLKLKPGAKQQD